MHTRSTNHETTLLQALAEEVGLPLVDNSHFTTAQRLEQWEKYNQKGTLSRQDEIVQHTQTVGAVAVDCYGCLAAATSTGGRTNKWDGRIGDTPMIGAGEGLGQGMFRKSVLLI